MWLEGDDGKKGGEEFIEAKLPDRSDEEMDEGTCCFSCFLLIT